MIQVTANIPNTRHEWMAALATPFRRASLKQLYCVTGIFGLVAATSWFNFADDMSDRAVRKRTHTARQPIESAIESTRTNCINNLYLEVGKTVTRVQGSNPDEFRPETLSAVAACNQRADEALKNIHVEPQQPSPVPAFLWTFAAVGLGGYTIAARSKRKKPTAPEATPM